VTIDLPTNLSYLRTIYFHTATCFKKTLKDDTRKTEEAEGISYIVQSKFDWWNYIMIGFFVFLIQMIFYRQIRRKLNHQSE